MLLILLPPAPLILRLQLLLRLRLIMLLVLRVLAPRILRNAPSLNSSARNRLRGQRLK